MSLGLGLGCRALGLRFWIEGLGFRVKGFQSGLNS